MNKNKKVKPIPKFKNEAEEREFWATHDLTDYLNQFQPVKLDLSELKPSTKPITVRLPVSLLVALKILAHKRDVPYQSLLKVFLAERVERETKIWSQPSL
ncbi:BrnA antitoxin family protein [Candidatus Shapirobacteria bacterium]|nr:BrnA antitoxin family protein [Candidatus Shapirobacteria bacterium]